jgi:hypothetical protein
MKTLHCLVLAITLLLAVTALAHEEPSKTLWEKTQTIRNRMKLSEAGISAVTQWRQEIKGSQPSPKVKAIRQEYDARGQLVLISALIDDSISASAVYSYTPAGDMVSDVDISSSGGIVEANLFTYDPQGRMFSGFACDSAGRPVGRFVHRFDKKKRWIEFVKFGGQDTVDYTIMYHYPDDYDKCDYVSAVKKRKGVDTVLLVKKVLDPQGRPVVKEVTDRTTQKSFSFHYAYDQNNVLIELTKRLSDGSIETRGQYLCNEDGTYREVRTVNDKGQLLRVTTFDYEHFRTTNPGRSK